MIISLKRYLWLWLALICLLFGQTLFAAEGEANQERPAGLTVVEINSDSPQETELCYLTMIIKTGYANDPEGKAGLTRLTNELFYYLTRNGSAFNISYNTLADFSIFNFTVTTKNYEDFCKELDYLIHQDALLMYDLCNELIRYHLSEPHPHSRIALINYEELIYGNTHPYFTRFNPNYKKLSINDANTWFRLIYRPNNIIIASSRKLPEDFLRRPFGRDIAKPVEKNETPKALFENIPSEKFAAIHDNLSTVIVGFPAPRFDTEECIPTILIQEYLQEKLWNEIRENSGLCYDLQVNYSCFYQPAAPNLMVVCQTLPEDTETVVAKIVNELKNLVADGIADTEKNRIIERGRNNRSVDDDLAAVVMDNALKVYFNQPWIADQNTFYDKLEQVSPDQVKTIMAERLNWLKISVAGPMEVNELLKELKPLESQEEAE